MNFAPSGAKNKESILSDYIETDLSQRDGKENRSDKSGHRACC